MQKKFTLEDILLIDLLPMELGNVARYYLVELRSEREVAEILNVPVSTAKQKIARAIFELRKLSNDPEYIKARKILYGN